MVPAILSPWSQLGSELGSNVPIEFFHQRPVAAYDFKTLISLSNTGTGVFVWVVSGRPFSSLFLQARYLADIVRDIWGVSCEIGYPGVQDVERKLDNHLRSDLPVIWVCGGFDRRLRRRIAAYKRAFFVYHNITPARFFWRSEPLVALKSLVGQAQIWALPRDIQWVTCSTFNETQLRRIGFRNVAICPNIIPPAADCCTYKPNTPSLLFIGRITPNKQCVELLNQVQCVSEALHREVFIDIIGDVKPGCLYGKAFRARLQRLQAHSFLRVRWHASDLSSQRLAEVYSSATLYVSTALHEGFGLPACEAVLHGTPALYVECGGTESVLDKHGMVPLGEKTEFWKRVVGLLQSPEARERLLVAQSRCVRNYTRPLVDSAVRKAFQPLIVLNQTISAESARA